MEERFWGKTERHGKDRETKKFQLENEVISFEPFFEHKKMIHCLGRLKSLKLAPNRPPWNEIKMKHF
jgi:hypothetical protein